MVLSRHLSPVFSLCCCLQLENGVERELHFCALIAGGEWRGHVDGLDRELLLF
jgi:hypothetical protein